ncbi:hypothetical protein ACEWY4_016984 [Coilia grayii]|uniref:Uncharacterized protein n=1 Tax=Coilia grayii TaxID=363190 RepID=A0ABD1JN56_9TELE
MDRDVVLEGLSTLLGVRVSGLPKNNIPKNVVVLPVEKLILRGIGGGHVFSDAAEIGIRSDAQQELFIDEEEFFDPQYDYDFTNLRDPSLCERGDEPYKRPAGWNRAALKVRGKYEDGDDWLGPNGWRSYSAPGEWPVSFHGTSGKGAKGIVEIGYEAGPRAVYGRGVYSTPDINEAERYYAKTFTVNKTKKTYKVVVQNRVNPKHRKICQRKDYWLIPVPEGTSAEKERKIVDCSIRPYGLLFKEVK